jgi:hypothetical protein
MDAFSVRKDFVGKLVLEPWLDRRLCGIISTTSVYNGEVIRYASSVFYPGPSGQPAILYFNKEGFLTENPSHARPADLYLWPVSDRNLRALFPLVSDYDEREEIMAEYASISTLLATTMVANVAKALSGPKVDTSTRVPKVAADVETREVSVTTTERTISVPGKLLDWQVQAIKWGAVFPDPPSTEYAYKVFTPKVTVKSNAALVEATFITDMGKWSCGLYKPWSQQLIAAWLIYVNRKYPLWMDMRTGKTLSAMMACERMIEEGIIDHVFVVCPVANMWDPWVKQIADYRYPPHIIDGNVEQDEAVLVERGRYYVTNYERLYSRIPLIRSHYDLSRCALIVDESSAIKNPAARRTRAIHDLCDQMKVVAVLNGTPLEQGPQDYWSQHRVVDQWGVYWGRTYSDFMSEWLHKEDDGSYSMDDPRKMELQISSTSFRCLRIEADASLGKDKTYRLIALPPTQQQVDQYKALADGFTTLETEDLGEVVEESPTNVLAKLLLMREIAAGYNKFTAGLKSDGNKMYQRVRQEVDPKMMWVWAYLNANVHRPLVIYTEFVEQQIVIIEMMQKLGITFRTMRKPPTKRKVRGLGPTISVDDMYLIEEYAKEVNLDRTTELGQQVDALYDLCLSAKLIGRHTIGTPSFISREFVAFLAADNGGMSDEAKKLLDKISKVRALADNNPDDLEAEAASAKADELEDKLDELLTAGGNGGNRFAHMMVEREETVMGARLVGKERSDAIADFNHGRADVIMMMSTQARGMNLSRKEAVAKGKGEWPTIIYIAPPWSLGAWQQSSDRCVTVDPSTGKSVNTMIYVVYTAGSIEETVLSALRRKARVQETILADTKREGFSSFVNDMAARMEDQLDSKEVFDVQDMADRITCHVPPYSKITKTIVPNKMVEAGLADEAGIKLTKKSVGAFIESSQSDLAKAARRLLLAAK